MNTVDCSGLGTTGLARHKEEQRRKSPHFYWHFIHGGEGGIVAPVAE